jgi:hypothetical protein
VQLAGGPVREIRADNNVLAVDVLRDHLIKDRQLS